MQRDEQVLEVDETAVPEKQAGAQGEDRNPKEKGARQPAIEAGPDFVDFAEAGGEPFRNIFHFLRRGS